MVGEMPSIAQHFAETKEIAPPLVTWPPLGSRQDSREEKPEFRLAKAIAIEPEEVKVCEPQVPLIKRSQRGTTNRIWSQKLHENLWNRKLERDQITKVYESMLRGENRSLVLITGAAGTGKSTLAKYALRDRVVADGGYFISGKFDQLRRPEPYRALVSAFSEFTNQVIERGLEEILDVRHRIREAVGDESYVLTSMIPALQEILDIKTEHSYVAATDGAIQHFVFVFRMFMRSLSSNKQPLVLLIEDLHFADNCSLDILASIIMDLKHIPGLVVIATCDESDELMNELSYLNRKLSEIEKCENVPITQLSLCNLPEVDVNNLLGNILNLSSLEFGKDLGSLVYHQTNGNLFYFSEFMLWMQESGLLLFDPVTSSWFWDIDEIRAQVYAQEVEEFVLHKLQKINNSMQEVLKVAACLGAEIHESLIAYVFGYPVKSILEEAADSGVIFFEQSSGKFVFEHDILQKAAYRLIPASDLELFHLEIGRRMWRQLNQEELDRYIFILLSQLNIGKRLIKREKERFRVASLCLHAGKKAAKSSTFRTAAVYFNFGIDLVGDQGWEEEYNLTLSLHNAAAEMELCTANYEKMDVLITNVLLKARQPLDKIQAQVTQLYAMGITDKQQQAIDKGMDLLRSLGEPLPKKMCKFRLEREICEIERMLKGMSNEKILRLPSIENREKLACMQILNILTLNALLARPKLSPFVALKTMKLTLRYGLSMMAPGAFATYAMVCISALGDFDSAFRFGDLSLELLGRSDGREYLPRVYAAYYGCIHPWRGHVLETLEPLLHANLVGLQTGDHEFSSLCANLYCFNALDAAIPLDIIEEKWTSFQETMVTNRQQSLLRMSFPCVQVIHHYMGLTSDPLASRGDLIDLDEAMKYAVDNKLNR
jgi:predicted ATPase